jgi:16S rRNA (guanine966-N2)-methyltransferase
MRIVAGVHGGRRLVAPAGDATRPTSDRVKESLFAILGPMDGLRVLDLYAGSGALGCEALSRGAAFVAFVEMARPALVALRANVASLHADDAGTTEIVPRQVEKAFAAGVVHPTFDVILADPPYAEIRSGKAVRAIRAIVTRGLLAPEGRLVVEHASADASPSLADVGLSAPEARRYGDTTLAFYDFS